MPASATLGARVLSINCPSVGMDSNETAATRMQITTTLTLGFISVRIVQAPMMSLFLAGRSKLGSGSEWREESTPQFEFSFFELYPQKLLKLLGYCHPLDFFTVGSSRTRPTTFHR